MTTTQNQTFHGVWLEPLDVLFFRDGRPFDASSRVASDLPNSQTLAGCLRNSLLAADGFDFQKFRKQRRDNVELLDALRASGGDHIEDIVSTNIRGPWLSFRPESDSAEPLLPMPSALRRTKQQRENSEWSLAKRKDDLRGWRSAGHKALG